MFHFWRIFCIYFTLFINGEGLTTPQGMKRRLFYKHEFSFLIPPHHCRARVLFLINFVLLIHISSFLNVSFTFGMHLWSQVEEVDALPAYIAALQCKCLKVFWWFLRKLIFITRWQRRYKNVFTLVKKQSAFSTRNFVDWIRR